MCYINCTIKLLELFVEKVEGMHARNFIVLMFVSLLFVVLPISESHCHIYQ